MKMGKEKIVDEWRDYNYAIFPFSQSPESLPLSISNLAIVFKQICHFIIYVNFRRSEPFSLLVGLLGRAIFCDPTGKSRKLLKDIICDVLG